MAIKCRNRVALVLLFLMAGFMTACIPRKKLLYVQQSAADTTYYSEKGALRFIKCYDELYIRVMSYDEKAYSFFNYETPAYQNASADLFSYTVDDSGYIDFPLIGKVRVEDLTLGQAKDSLQERLALYLRQPGIVIKYVGKYITVLGEVKTPGKYLITREQTNVLEALALAGDMTDFGKRSNVTVIRTKGDSVSYHYLDLTQASVVASPCFYLLPDDIVYVEPMRAKSLGVSSFPFGTILAAISTLVTVLYFIDKK